jgi:crotonobetainyl-CoA hydratase
MDAVLIEKRGRTALITLNRPDVLNAVNAELADGLGRALETLAQDDDLWVGVICGAGRAFSVGADLKELAAGRSIRPPAHPEWGFAGFVRHPVAKPLIAAVRGYALGGGLEMALACDLIVAGETARFGLPEVQRGLVAAAGGLLRLPRQLPLKVALEMILTGEPLSAADALRWGLVNRVVPDDQVVPEALALAERIARNAPLAVRTSKAIVYRGLDLPLDYPASAWAVNEDLAARVRVSEDAREGARAFVEHRDPVWRGR